MEIEGEHRSYKLVEFGILVVVLILLFKFTNFSLRNERAEAIEWEKEVNIYFTNSKMGSDDDCSKVFAVKRVIPNAEVLGPGAIDKLLSGVSRNEISDGYGTAINQGVILQKFEIKDGVAYADFNQTLSETGGSCRVIAIRSQIEKTLTGISGVKGVVISVNGNTQGILEP